jgi:hypothetical protein
MKIFITGCAKTGTTLVRRLFNAFELKVFNQSEISLQGFVDSDFEVGKRTIDTIFSNTLSEEIIDDQLNLIKIHDIKIINVVRNKENVLKSSNGWVPESRYNSTLEQSQKYSNFINYTIEYEKLLLNPNGVQKEVEEHFGLKKIHLWSDYPSFMKSEEEPLYTKKDLSYSLRKIDESY